MVEFSLEKKKEKIRKMLSKNNSRVVGDMETKNLNEISKSFYKINLIPEMQEYEQKYSALLKKQDILDPFFNINHGIINDTTIINDEELVSFSSYNYLGFSGDKQVSNRAKEAIDEYGTSVSASRMITGEKPVHLELEKNLADFLRVDSSVVFTSGHATNVTVIGHLFGPQDIIFHDSLAHNSIVQGALLSGARRIPFPHNDWKALEELLKDNRTEYNKALIAIEGVYSVDGDIPDLPKFIKLRDKYKSFLMVDEAHSIGVLGKTGRGISEHFKVNPKEIDIWMGTLSKTFASCGGYIAGNKQLVKYLKHTTPGFMFSVGIPPANAAASLAVVDILKKDNSKVKKLQSNAKFFLKQAKKLGFNTGLSHDSAVIPVVIGDSLKAIKLTNFLFSNGINVSPILYPAVAEEEARLRFFITSDHKKEQMVYTLSKIEEGLNNIN